MTLFFPTEIIPGTTQGNINEFTLQQIIAMALENNRDLTVALLNIEQAKAAYQIKKSDELPVIAGSTGLSRQGIPPSA